MPAPILIPPTLGQTLLPRTTHTGGSGPKTPPKNGGRASVQAPKQSSPLYAVVLFNDDFHTYDDVVKACSNFASAAQGLAIGQAVNQHGAAAICVGTQAALSPIFLSLQRQKFGVELVRVPAH